MEYDDNIDNRRRSKYDNRRKMYQTINQFQKGYQHKLKCVFYLFLFFGYIF